MLICELHPSLTSREPKVLEDIVLTSSPSLERTNLSRIEPNPDLPPYLQVPPNQARFYWMVDRDGPGAGFVEFDAQALKEYQAKKGVIDAEPDFERTMGDLSFNLENTQAQSLPPADWRLG